MDKCIEVTVIFVSCFIFACIVYRNVMQNKICAIQQSTVSSSVHFTSGDYLQLEFDFPVSAIKSKRYTAKLKGPQQKQITHTQARLGAYKDNSHDMINARNKPIFKDFYLQYSGFVHVHVRIEE